MYRPWASIFISEVCGTSERVELEFISCCAYLEMIYKSGSGIAVVKGVIMPQT